MGDHITQLPISADSAYTMVNGMSYQQGSTAFQTSPTCITTDIPDIGYGYEGSLALKMNDTGSKRKRNSMPEMDGIAPLLSPEEEDGGSAKGKGKRGSVGHSHGVAGLTSCEACRKGKRRCEPSPLVPPNHPDVAKLPCARCRRFALECVRVKVSRRKGPAPVDLSAYSDAAHGYAPVASGSGSSLDGVHHDGLRPGTGRRQSSVHSESYDFPQMPIAQPGVYPSPLSFPILAQSPNMTNGYLPDNLDQVVAPHVTDTIIALFFDYVYPLTPCLHRPTFLANLTARRDKSDPIFFALTLAVIASTLVQVPRTLVNLEKSEVESLARRCIRVARAKVAFIWEDPGAVQSTFILISYLEGIVHLLLGNNTAHVIATAQANQLALALRLNEESSYVGLDAIECEIRRRIYWLLFQADKSTACLRARTICLRLDDAQGLQLPSEVDDESITPSGILPQPSGKTPLISGFNAVTNLFRILNDALLLQRRKTLYTLESVLVDLSNIDQLRDTVRQTMAELPSALQLRRAYDSRVSSPAQGWETKLQERILDYFHGAGESSEELNSFLVMQGNILVTQYVVRLVLLQTRESLLQQLAVLSNVPIDGVAFSANGQVQSSEAAEDIACELLDGLNSLPVECVATNGPSLVQKVRFVAIQLLECSVNPSPQTAKAQKLLMQFLSVLSVIEGMYTFGVDISAE